MNHWISFSSEVPKPSSVDAVASAFLDAAPTLAHIVGADGGLRRRDLVASLAPVAQAHSLSVTSGGTFAVSELDLVGAEARLAVSVQAGRAKANNGALRAVLAAGAHPGVSWLVLFVPVSYKGSPTAAPILDDLRILAATPGVRLDLGAVLVVSF